MRKHINIIYKVTIVIFILLIISHLAFGQNLTKKDSIQLVKFIKADSMAQALNEFCTQYEIGFNGWLENRFVIKHYYNLEKYSVKKEQELKY